MPLNRMLLFKSLRPIFVHFNFERDSIFTQNYEDQKDETRKNKKSFTILLSIKFEDKEDQLRLEVNLFENGEASSFSPISLSPIVNRCFRFF
jgi:hypothetical protein